MGDDDDSDVEEVLAIEGGDAKEKKKGKKVTDVNDDDDEEARQMKALLAGWEGEGGGDDDDDDDDDESVTKERAVNLNDHVVDHIVLAAGDLEEGMAEFQKKAGIEPVIFGTIKGLGIRCARVSFNDSSYIEIIAPDTKVPGPIGESIKAKAIKELTPFHYAIRYSDIEELKEKVTEFGYNPDLITMFGAKSDGTPRKWQMLHLYSHKMGGICPFFINWANTDHPCATLPIVGKLEKFKLSAPEGDPVHQLFELAEVEGITLAEGEPDFFFQFGSPQGTVSFSTSKPAGYKYPGFEEEETFDDDD